MLYQVNPISEILENSNRKIEILRYENIFFFFKNFLDKNIGGVTNKVSGN